MQLKVQVWIYYQDPKSHQLFFLILCTRPERGSFWQPITGSVEEGETLEQAARREVQEETGLDCFSEKIQRPVCSLGIWFEYSKERLRKELDLTKKKEKIFFREFGFYLEVSSNEALKGIHLDPTEHTDFLWASGQEVIKKIKHASNARVFQHLLKQLNVESD